MPNPIEGLRHLEKGSLTEEAHQKQFDKKKKKVYWEILHFIHIFPEKIRNAMHTNK